MDDLRQLYEIKLESSKDVPTEVTLTKMELDAAQDDEDFFLAIVTGLSRDVEGFGVRFIFNPLAGLGVRIKGDVTLTGVADVEALEYQFEKEAPDLDRAPVDDQTG